jgi:hypothetical protein
VRGEFSAAHRVRAHLLTVLTTIELDDELSRRTRKIDNTLADWMLPTEFPL